MKRLDWSLAAAIGSAALIAVLCFGAMRAASAAEPASRTAAKPATAYTPGPMLQRFLDGPMAGIDEIVFAVRVPGRDHWYVTFGNYADHSLTPPQQLGFKFQDGVYWGYGDGGRLCRLNLRTGQLTVLLDDPQGRRPRSAGPLRRQEDPLLVPQGRPTPVPPLRDQHRRHRPHASSPTARTTTSSPPTRPTAASSSAPPAAAAL